MKLAIKVNTVDLACIPRHAVVVKICEVAINQLGIKGDNICVYDVDFTAHSGHHPGPAVGVEVEEVRVGPDVGAVAGHVHGDVAHQPQAQVGSRVLHHRPLAEEDELAKRLPW